MGQKHSKKKKKQSHQEFEKGILEISKSGTGFVKTEGRDEDILIQPEKLGHALDGDEVRVLLLEKTRHNGRQRGVIQEVLRRGQTEFAGVLQVKEHFAFLIPDKSNMPVDIYVPLDLINGAKNGDKVVVRVTEWTGKSRNPVGEVVSILTNETQNEIAMQGILIDSGFPLHFPDAVMEEVARIPDNPDASDKAERRDFRDVLTFTIDPVDAKDFDDALSYRQIKKDVYEIGVHIADVSHYVEKGTPLDEEAYRRATSVYLPDRVLPMLPERLSNQLCSLRPQEEKLSFSAVFHITKQGRIKEYWLGKTIICSDRRYTYEEVQEVIKGGEDQNAEVLLLLNDLAQGLRKERLKKGAINFSSQEVRFVLDEDAKPVDVIVKQSMEAHQLIEEFMLLANRQVATYVSEQRIKDKPVPFAYRVHDVPDEEKLRLFTSFAARFGHRLDLNTPQSIARSFNEMLKAVQGKPEQNVLESLGIRTMSKAVYTTDNIGHYGLGFENYCHFTSPIRRYPDILVHRILLECLQHNVKPEKHLEAVCRHCSDMERKAMEAERTANKYKQVEFMQQHLGEEFDAVVSGTASFGFWAETVEYKCEGMVSITDLSTFDQFELIEEDYALVGKNTGIRFRIGDRVRVRVVSASLEKRQLDYTLSELPRQPGKTKSENAPKKRGKKRKQHQ